MKTFLILAATIFASEIGFPWSVEAGINVGLVSMDYLNGWLAELAVRDGADLAPLRFSWGWDLSFWPWSLLGLGLEGLFLTGKILGREEKTLSVTALGLQGRISLGFAFLGQALKVEAGAGGLGAWTAGLLEASGLGWGGSLGLLWRIFQFWGLEIGVRFVYRWAWVPVLYTPREELRPRTGPALDFSGPFGWITVRWTW